jgi:hypothetical protein
MWDRYYQCPDATWAELKTLKQHCMLYGLDSDSYKCDFYHAMACFYAVEDGLFRTDGQQSVRKSVFPELHLPSANKRHPSFRQGPRQGGLHSGADTLLATNREISYAAGGAGGQLATVTYTPLQTQRSACHHAPSYAANVHCITDHISSKIEG